MNQKIKELINYGADVEFCIGNKNYVILPWTDDGIVVGEVGGEDYSFETFNDLMDNYVIDGKLFKDIVDKINITFTSGC